MDAAEAGPKNSSLKKTRKLSSDEKKAVRKEVVSPEKVRREGPRCVVCTLPMGREGGCQGHSPATPATPRSPSASRPRPASPHKSSVAVSVSKRTPTSATSPHTYTDLSRSVGHTIRCYITPEYVLKLVRKQAHRSNATLADAEHLHLKCSGIGEEYVRIENLGGLKNLKTLIASNHAFSKIEGLQPLVSLTSLDLSNNRLQRVEGISHLVYLKELNLSGNYIEHIPPAVTFPPSLQALCMSSNRLANLDDLHHLRGLVGLVYLDLRDNAMCEHSHYRSIAAYAGLSIKYLDTIEITEAERSAALYHWDRKGLKPLESELRETKRLLDATKRELEEARQQSKQKDGQLDAVTKLLKLTSTNNESMRQEKIKTEEELKQHQTNLASLQSNFLQTKSDYEFLKIEMETLYPEAAKEILQQCTNTLGDPEPTHKQAPRQQVVHHQAVSPPPRRPPPPPVDTLPTVASLPTPAAATATQRAVDFEAEGRTPVTRQIDLGNTPVSKTSKGFVPKTPETLLQSQGEGIESGGYTFRHLQEQIRAQRGGAVDATPPIEESGDYSTPPHYDPDARSPSRGASVDDFTSISPTPEDPIVAPAPSNAPPVSAPASTTPQPYTMSAIQKELRGVKKPALPPGIVRAIEERERASAGNTPSATPAGPSPITTPSTAPAPTPRGVDPNVQFKKLIKKALYCERCAQAYVAKAQTELAKCSAPHVMAKLEALYPGFAHTLGEEDIMAYAEGQLKYHRERSAMCEEKRLDCLASCEKYLKRAMELVPHVT